MPTKYRLKGPPRTIFVPIWEGKKLVVLENVETHAELAVDKAMLDIFEEIINED